MRKKFGEIQISVTPGFESDINQQKKNSFIKATWNAIPLEVAAFM